jgi:hypothetical protein
MGEMRALCRLFEAYVGIHSFSHHALSCVLTHLGASQCRISSMYLSRGELLQAVTDGGASQRPDQTPTSGSWHQCINRSRDIDASAAHSTLFHAWWRARGSWTAPLNFFRGVSLILKSQQGLMWGCFSPMAAS